MATACDSDGELTIVTTTAELVPVQQSGMESVIPAQTPATSSNSSKGLVSNAVHSLQGFSPKALCCTANNNRQLQTISHCSKPGVDTTECNPNHQYTAANSVCTTGSSSQQSTSPDHDSPHSSIVPLLSEYYNYIESIQNELESSAVSVDELRYSLQYVPCLAHSPAKQLLFNSNSSIHKPVSDLNSFVSTLKDHCSWYNHGLFSYLAKLYTQRSDLIDQYTATLSQHCSDLLLLLPAVSTGPQCPESFEELRVFTGSPVDRYTLGDTIQLHERLADVLGLRTGVTFMQGLSKAKTGAMFLFWIPKSVGSQALSTAAKNIDKLSETEIRRIEGLYKTVISVPSHEDTHRLALAASTVSRRFDSGYAEAQMHSLSDALDPPVSPLYQTATTSITLPTDTSTSSFDDVFITQVSPDSSAQYSIEIGTIDSTSGSEVSLSPEHGVLTPVISPPPLYATSLTTGVKENDSVDFDNDENQVETDCETDARSSTEVLNEISNSTERVNIDSEILREIERQNCQDSPLSTPPVTVKQPLIWRAPEHDEPDGAVPHKVTAVRSQSLNTESSYIKMDSVRLRAQILSPSQPEFSPPIVTHCTRQFVEERHYQLTMPKETTGFVKRVLLRSSLQWPAQLHMVSISYQHGSSENGLLHVRAGQKLLAQYLEGDYIIATDTATSSTGKVPYSMCRISTSYYDKSSKLTQLAYCHLYTLSTLNIQEITDTQDGFRTIHPVNIDLVVIKSYSSQSKDELSVRVGSHIRLLYGDSTWVYGSTGANGTAGFVPRSHCRLVRQSRLALQRSHWLLPRLPFQADFRFTMSLPPPEFLMKNKNLPKTSEGEIRTLTRNYVAPGSQYILKRGSTVKTLYCERDKYFRFVATINGTSFWVPSTFTSLPNPSFPTLPATLQYPMNEAAVTPRPRPRAHTISGAETERVCLRKKVSFASETQMAIIHSVRSSLCQSNPELSLTDDNEDTDPRYATIPVSSSSPRRTRSSENLFPAIFYFDPDSPTNLCCRFFCF